jgi:hypothetical protein
MKKGEQLFLTKIYKILYNRLQIYNTKEQKGEKRNLKGKNK